MNLHIPSDDVLRAQGGDARALDRLIRALTPAVRSMLKRFPLSDEDRTDAAQNTLLRVCLALPGYRQEAQFSTWLYRVCTNEALMVMRKVRTRSSRQVEIDLDLVMDETEEPPAQEGTRLRGALQELPEHYRAVLGAYYGEGHSLGEIAVQIGESESATRARLHRARLSLRQRLGLGPADHEAASLRAA